MRAKLLQLWPTLCDPVDYSRPQSSIHGILQERILEWVAVPSTREFPDPEIKRVSLMSLALADGFFTTSTTWEAHAPQGLAKGGFFVCLCMGSHKIMPL